MDSKSFYIISKGFVYYQNPSLSKRKSISYVPLDSKGFFVLGNNFKSNFSGADLSCKINKQILKAEYFNSNKLFCKLNKKFKYDSLNDKYKIYISLNNENFVPEPSINNNFVIFFKISKFRPQSGPTTGKSKVYFLNLSNYFIFNFK